MPPCQVDGGELVHPLVRASGGYLDHARSPLVPYCGAVLVAADVVVTAATCVEDGWADLSFGIGEPGGATTRVVAARRHPDASDPQHALVALVLERPVPGVSAAGLVPLEAMPCEVELPTYATALRDAPAARSVWRACGIGVGTSLVATEGHPSCHGEPGTGAFVGEAASDRVIGWVTGAGHLGDSHPIDDVCVTSVDLATVAANLDFLADARARSRVDASRAGTPF